MLTVTSSLHHAHLSIVLRAPRSSVLASSLACLQAIRAGTVPTVMLVVTITVHFFVSEATSGADSSLPFYLLLHFM